MHVVEGVSPPTPLPLGLPVTEGVDVVQGCSPILGMGRSGRIEIVGPCIICYLDAVQQQRFMLLCAGLSVWLGLAGLAGLAILAGVLEVETAASSGTIGTNRAGSVVYSTAE